MLLHLCEDDDLYFNSSNGLFGVKTIGRVQHAHGKLRLVLIDKHATLIPPVGNARIFMPRTGSELDIPARMPPRPFHPNPDADYLRTLGMGIDTVEPETDKANVG